MFPEMSPPAEMVGLSGSINGSGIATACRSTVPIECLSRENASNVFGGLKLNPGTMASCVLHGDNRADICSAPGADVMSIGISDVCGMVG